jgi:hypothetical protein
MIHEKKGAAYRDGIPFFDFRLQSFDVDFRKNCCRLAARPADSSFNKKMEERRCVEGLLTTFPSNGTGKRR